MRLAFAFLSLALACTARVAPPPADEHGSTVVLAPPASSAPVTVAPDPSAAPTHVEAPVDDGKVPAEFEVKARETVIMPRNPYLANEIQSLEQLLAAMSPASPDLGQVLFRLGRDYVELRQGSGSAGASRALVTKYGDLRAKVPSFAKMDEVLYQMALEYELLGEVPNARKMLYELIVKFPSSKLVPLAYFGFGELFLREAKGDASKWPLAQQSYLEALKYPATPIEADARWRLGQVYAAQGNYAAAMASNAQLKKQFPQSDAAAKIGQPP